MKEIYTNITIFLFGVVVGGVLGFVSPRILTPEPNVVITTNSVHQIGETNRASTTYGQVDWFKNDSNYIWDDWKIK